MLTPCQKSRVKPICCISWLRLDKKRRLYAALCHCKWYWLQQSLETESEVLTQGRHSASMILVWYTRMEIYVKQNRRNSDQEICSSGIWPGTPWDKDCSRGWSFRELFLHAYFKYAFFFFLPRLFISATFINEVTKTIPETDKLLQKGHITPYFWRCLLVTFCITSLILPLAILHW